MSVYSELLKMAVEQDRCAAASPADLLSRAMKVRPADVDGAATADRIAEWLAYDVILVRLCEYLGLPQRMLDPDAGPASRTEAEVLVGGYLPVFSRALKTA